MIEDKGVILSVGQELRFNATADALPALAQRRNAAGVSGAPNSWHLVFND